MLRFSVFRLLTDFVYLYNYEFWLSLCKIVRSSVILLLPLLIIERAIAIIRQIIHARKHVLCVISQHQCLIYLFCLDFSFKLEMFFFFFLFCVCVKAYWRSWLSSIDVKTFFSEWNTAVGEWKDVEVLTQIIE